MWQMMLKFPYFFSSWLCKKRRKCSSKLALAKGVERDLGLEKKTLGKDGACKILSIFIPWETYGVDWSSWAGHGLLLRLLLSSGFFFQHPPEWKNLFLNGISRISPTIIATQKQYSKNVCYSLVMWRSLLCVKKLFPYSLCQCFVHHWSGSFLIITQTTCHQKLFLWQR